MRFEFVINTELTRWLLVRMAVSKALISVALWIIGAGLEWVPDDAEQP